MKKTVFSIFLSLASVIAFAQLTMPPSGDNQKASVTQFIGPVSVSISYSSPDVHGPSGEDRQGHIWGELVPYGFVDQGFGVKSAPWRAGANENTVITFSHDVVIGGKTLKAGAYGLFLALSKEGTSNWIFSTNYTSWGSYFYNEKEDALRAPAQVEDAPYTEWLTFGFEDRRPASTVAFLQWENKRILLKIEVPNINQVYVDQLRKELRSDLGFEARNWLAAAQFCAQNKTNLEEALTWSETGMDPSFGGVEDFNALQIKAAVLTALGKENEASTIMDKAIKAPGANMMAVHLYGRSLLAAGKKEKALDVFLYNYKKYPEEKFTTNVGLARAYTAMGDKKNAIKYWQVAMKNVPDNQKPFISAFEGELKKLKEGSK